MHNDGTIGWINGRDCSIAGSLLPLDCWFLGNFVAMTTFSKLGMLVEGIDTEKIGGANMCMMMAQLDGLMDRSA